MFKIHKEHTGPNNSLQKLWRYMSYERLVQIINDEKIYFAHINKMDDQWEGRLTSKTKDALFKSELLKYNGDVQAANGAVEQYENFKNDFFINCWHMNDYESYLMWKAYGSKQCAIQTNFERLVESFQDLDIEIHGCVIKYIDYQRERFPIGNTFHQIAYKDLPYKSENEFRLLSWRPEYQNLELQPRPIGVIIDVDIKMLIKNIYINPNVIVDTSELESLISKKNLSCEILNTSIWEKSQHNNVIAPDLPE